MASTIPRSYLFVPGNRAERFDKALAAGADAVIIDLEDAVAPADKSAARLALTRWLTPGHQVLVRINGADTPWFADDLHACRHAGVHGIVLPKAEREQDLAHVHATLGVAVLPLIETARGIDQARQLACVEGVQRLLFGTIDFKLDLGIHGDREELHYFRSALVLASRLAGIAAPVDGVTTAIDDPQQIRTDTDHGRRMGFGAKLCIHPRQLAAIHAAFAPSSDEVRWAQRVLAAAGAAGPGAVALDGKMIDRPVIVQAEQVLARAAGPA